MTNLQNGRSLRLRVNDRGPFVDGRLIDVSRRAAQLLGFEAEGTAPVEVKIVKDASIRVAEEAMRNSGQVLLADAGAAAIDRSGRAATRFVSVRRSADKDGHRSHAPAEVPRAEAATHPPGAVAVDGAGGADGARGRDR